MKQIIRKTAALLLVFVLLLTLAGCGGAETKPQEQPDLEAPLQNTASWLLETVPEPQTGTIGGEWLVFGLARSNEEVPERYFDHYYAALEKQVSDLDGVLHEKKYTEYSRVVLALTAIGKDPTDVAGYNLLAPLADYEQTIFQGVNGAIFALLAMDSGNYTLPEAGAEQVQANRERYIDHILSMEVPNGGWSLAGSEPEVDMTAMALQALAKYQGRQDVKEAVERGVTVLSELQGDDGGYTAYDTQSSESIAQVIVALTELGIDLQDERFVKNGNTLLDRLLAYQSAEGGFYHVLDGDVDLMATEQAFYALVALDRAERGESTLYTMAA